MKKTNVINLNKYKKAKNLKCKKNKEMEQSNMTVEDNIIIDELKQGFKYLMNKGED